MARRHNGPIVPRSVSASGDTTTDRTILPPTTSAYVLGATNGTAKLSVWSAATLCCARAAARNGCWSWRQSQRPVHHYPPFTPHHVPRLRHDTRLRAHGTWRAPQAGSSHERSLPCVQSDSLHVEPRPRCTRIDPRCAGATPQVGPSTRSDCLQAPATPGGTCYNRHSCAEPAPWFNSSFPQSRRPPRWSARCSGGDCVNEPICWADSER